MKRIYNKEAVEKTGEKVKLIGWIHNVRSHGKIIFADLRDTSGLIQVVFTPSMNKDCYESSKKLRSEWVIELDGKVNKRPKNMVNPNIETGEIEIEAENLKILSESETLPFDIEGDGREINEETRLKYRYLDLRRERVSKNLKKRHETIQFMRNYLQDEGFIEIETPILTKSTPEGARDFLVPSRAHVGEFYALPQSPQQYKQLLMVSGIEKYFQIARCFRDEDSRANRQAEFTQLDLEMSFMSQEEIMSFMEELFIKIVEIIFPEKNISEMPFPRMTHKEVMNKYGNDCPDIRKNKDDKEEAAFLWVTDFPMFSWSEKEKRWDAEHHPFTRPKEEDISKIKKDPKSVAAFQYDLVLNGEEIGGGSLRSYKPEILEAVFEVLGHKKEDIRNKFGHLLEAFKYGVPPHGGIAVGFDRFLSILLDEENIREVIAFPKAGDSRDLMMGAPSGIEKEQLEELNLAISKKRNEDKQK